MWHPYRSCSADSRIGRQGQASAHIRLAVRAYQGRLSLIGKAAAPLRVVDLQDLPPQSWQSALRLAVLRHRPGHALAAVDDDLGDAQRLLAQRRLEVCLVHLHQMQRQSFLTQQSHTRGHELAAVDDELNDAQGVLAQRRLEIGLIHLHQVLWQSLWSQQRQADGHVLAVADDDIINCRASLPLKRSHLPALVQSQYRLTSAGQTCNHAHVVYRSARDSEAVCSGNTGAHMCQAIMRDNLSSRQQNRLAKLG